MSKCCDAPMFSPVAEVFYFIFPISWQHWFTRDIVSQSCIDAELIRLITIKDFEYFPCHVFLINNKKVKFTNVLYTVPVCKQKTGWKRQIFCFGFSFTKQFPKEHGLINVILIIKKHQQTLFFTSVFQIWIFKLSCAGLLGCHT
jgi:hypothetical protein